MKILFTFLLITLAFNSFPQVYAEFYNTKTGDVFLSDTYQLLLYDNAMGLESLNDPVSVPHTGFQAKLFFINYNDSLRTLYSSNFKESDELCILRLRIWDEKLYGYCYTGEVDVSTDRFIVTLIGTKNVPQRKKLLFKDSSKMRMWKYPWISE